MNENKVKLHINTDIVIVGTGVGGLFTALNLPRDKQIVMITKADLESSDSFLAQGGICVLKNEDDYDSYFEDTMRAGHYENRKESVDIMIRSSREIIDDLIGYGVDFERDDNGHLRFTREGAHSTPRILFHEDITGKEITSKLLAQVQKLPNVTILENTEMVDIVEQDNVCYGIVCRVSKEAMPHLITISAKDTVWACGGIGGLFQNSTNYPHIAGDGLGIAMKHQVKLEHLDYIQIHPTTLFSHKPGRRFLISESVRGEGALLYDKNGQRFTNELQPRDLLSQAIFEQMEKDGTDFVWEDMRPLGEKTIMQHFPNIYQHCIEEGFDPRKEPIPVVPAQHYFMGGIQADLSSRTSMRGLYACGETSCNGVHGKNRLASNSLLESLVFARRAADDIIFGEAPELCRPDRLDLNQYEDQNVILEGYHKQVLNEIERMKKANE